MVDLSRRTLLSTGAALAGAAALPASIARAAAIAPDRRSGTIADVEHVVILAQENRGFDHYFGSLRGVRGFADRFPIPTPAGTVWQQTDRTGTGGPRIVGPFHLDTARQFDLMRMEGTPHSWPDAQRAWDEGRMAHWPEAKHPRAMGHYRRSDIPFQFALAEAFTICDAYHCAVQTGTNTNRLFLWSGTNDPAGQRGGPAIGNSHDNFVEQGGAADPYRWTTTVERLQAAGVDWRIYQDMDDNFTDNPLAGFAAFRDAHAGHGDAVLKDRALTTRGPDLLKADVLAGRLPQVSYVIATAAGSEHPGPSSPAQGADYTARVLDALTADRKVWARTVLLVMFDENDGFFDHMPPPAPPARGADGTVFGGSSIDLTGEYHEVPSSGDAAIDLPAYRGRPYGLGPRVPLYVVSPWSRGGWVNSQTFDHTSVIRFLEARFGIHEPNISAWRRAICGDLTSAFDFTATDAATPVLPDPAGDARRAAAIKGQVTPDAPTASAPWQESGIRRSRALPYRLDVIERGDATGVNLRFAADGVGAVFHVYDRHALDQPPRRYSVGASDRIDGHWPYTADGGYDLWVLGPNGFHRQFVGHRGDPAMAVAWSLSDAGLALRVGTAPGLRVRRLTPGGGASEEALPAGRHRWSFDGALGWYDVTLSSSAAPGWHRRIAGRHDRAGRASSSDPFVAGIGAG
ncbi:phospholipase C, phosphocholine-specific [Sphingomonas sp. Leaf24]|uniref:phosphocholine-specific phospholipase C n=1 Tax=unclassified Sphingomonas TaxID=196159 RepID=UPI0006F29D08|nr:MULTISPECIES: phospholipase C, phosphocholine-specific [unclassified Sphingomonas]KQM13661.1 phospholipase C, phosphocholine-specific [Sphingomonas sp. Leaf5]KQM86746.1 phospholipase C, phosphocholine-specific [Sphingomonas sp. Leaf24]